MREGCGDQTAWVEGNVGCAAGRHGLQQPAVLTVPPARRRCSGELPSDVGKLAHHRQELLLRRATRGTVARPVDAHPDGTERVPALVVIAQRHNFHPSTVESVQKRAPLPRKSLAVTPERYAILER